LTDSEVQTLQAGQTFVKKAAVVEHIFRLWITGRTVGWPLHWPNFLPEEPFIQWLSRIRIRVQSVYATFPKASPATLELAIAILSVTIFP
jgi:hypothetical protein